MKIEVTEEDIRLGRKGEVTQCPVARAIQRVTGNLTDWAGFCFMQVGGIEIRTPRAVFQFMGRFDYDKPVNPFEFEVEVGTVAER